MSKSKLKTQIENKLDKLAELLDSIDDAHVINSDDSETWDPDAFYDLVANLKEALALLEDKEDKKKDNFGEPIILETGLCSLVDEYNSEEEEISDD